MGRARKQILTVFLAGTHACLPNQFVSRHRRKAIRARLGSTWGLAVTGNAGPTEDKDGPAPIGTTLVAVAGPDGTETRPFRLYGGRIELQARGASWALDMLRRKLLC